VKGRRNYLGGFFGRVWLAIIFIPVYYIVITSFKDQAPISPKIPCPTQSADVDGLPAGRRGRIIRTSSTR
jgi:hypothetical protein